MAFEQEYTWSAGPAFGDGRYEDEDADDCGSPLRLGSPGPSASFKCAGVEPADALTVPAAGGSARTLVLRPDDVTGSGVADAVLSPPVSAATRVMAAAEASTDGNIAGISNSGSGGSGDCDGSGPDGGLSLVEVSMRDAVTGERLWAARGLSAAALARGELEVRLPESSLRTGAVLRSITFHSPALLRNLAMTQRTLLCGSALGDEHRSHFGFVMPRSTNTWESTVEGAGGSAARSAGGAGGGGGAGDELRAAAVSGKVQIETVFTDGGHELLRFVCRIFYY